jgi:hypothetical protein
VYTRGVWFREFKFATPYTVDTSASKWRFYLTNSGAGVTIPTARTSDGTNPFYVTWCDTQLTSADNDCLVVVDPVTIDKSIYLKGTTGTGSILQWCGYISAGTSSDPATICKLTWQNPPSASYTLSLEGMLVLGAHSGFRVGTEANPIPLDKPAIISLPNATLGGSYPAYSGLNSVTASAGYDQMSIFFYGAVANNVVNLSGGVAKLATTLTTATASGWAIGDKFYFTQFVEDGYESVGNPEKTITNISGTTIDFTPASTTHAVVAGSEIVRVNKAGIKMMSTTTNGGYTSKMQATLNNPPTLKETEVAIFNKKYETQQNIPTAKGHSVPQSFVEGSRQLKA